MWLATRRANRPGSGWTKNEVENLLYAGFLGVFLGGRIGYVLFYNFPQFMADQRTQAVSGGTVRSNTKEQDPPSILPAHDLTDHLPEHAGAKPGVFLLSGVKIVNVLLSDSFFHDLIPPAPFCYSYYRQAGQLLFVSVFPLIFLVNTDGFTDIGSPSLLQDIT